MQTIEYMNNLANYYYDAAQYEQSIQLYEQILALRQATQGLEKPLTVVTMHNLAMSYQKDGQIDRAIPLFRSEIDQERKSPTNLQMYGGLLATFATILLKEKGWVEAEAILRECLSLRQQQQADDWTTFNTMSLLGGALLGQAKYAEAEPLLKSGYEGMKQRAATIPPPGKTRPVEALDRLIQLPEATGKPDEAKAWRGEKDRIHRPSGSRPSTDSRPAPQGGGEAMSQPPPAGDYFPQVYDELRRLAASKLRGEVVGHTLNATALVHEAYLRLGSANFGDRSGFFRAAAVAMQRILVDYARNRRALKRGGTRQRFTVGEADRFGMEDPDTLLDVATALGRLTLEDPGAADLARLRLFAGLSVEDAAEALGLSPATAFREWAYARAWLADALKVGRPTDQTHDEV